MLCDEGVNDSFLLLQTKVEDPTGWNLAFPKTNISGMACPISMESLCNSGGDKEHPVQIITALAQSLSGDKALGNRIPILIPFQVHIQINTLTRTIIGGAEDICALGYLPSVLPPLIQQEIFVRQATHVLELLPQLLKDLLAGALTNVFTSAGVLFAGYPAFCFNDFHGILFSMAVQVSQIQAGRHRADPHRKTRRGSPFGFRPQ